MFVTSLKINIISGEICQRTNAHNMFFSWHGSIVFWCQEFLSLVSGMSGKNYYDCKDKF